MNVARRSVLLRNGADHEFEEDVTIRSDQCIIIVPVHFELAVRILMIVLICAPSERKHRVADLLNDGIATHQG